MGSLRSLRTQSREPKQIPEPSPLEVLTGLALDELKELLIRIQEQGRLQTVPKGLCVFKAKSKPKSKRSVKQQKVKHWEKARFWE
jgi:hypothetical protein